MSSGGVRKRKAPRWHVDATVLTVDKFDTGRGRKCRGKVHGLPTHGPDDDYTVTSDFFKSHTLDKAPLPAHREGDGLVLDMAHVTAARKTPLFVLPTCKHLACIQHDLAQHLAGNERRCRGDYDAVDWGALEGMLVPWFAPTGKLSKAKDEFEPWADTRKPPAFAMQPVVLAIMADRESDRAFKSELVALAYIVSPRTWNVFDKSDDFKVRLNPAGCDEPLVNPGGYSTAHYVLVVKALPKVWLSMGAHNPLDNMFKWQEWSKETKPPQTGLGDVLMHGGSIVRAILPMPVSDVMAMLRRWREEDETLSHKLFPADHDQKMDVPGSKDKTLTGLVVRKALLIEHLLRDSPLEYLLSKTAPSRHLLDLRVPLPSDGAAGLFSALCAATADPEFSSWFGTIPEKKNKV